MNEARFFNVRDGVVTILSARELSVYVGLFAVHSLDLPPRVLSRTSANGFQRERSSVCIFAKKKMRSGIPRLVRSPALPAGLLRRSLRWDGCPFRLPGQRRGRRPC
jgi:hypothetical protein